MAKTAKFRNASKPWNQKHLIEKFWSEITKLQLLTKSEDKIVNSD